MMASALPQAYFQLNTSMRSPRGSSGSARLGANPSASLAALLVSAVTCVTAPIGSAHAQTTQVPGSFAVLPVGYKPFPATGGYAPGTLLVRNTAGEQVPLYDATSGDTLSGVRFVLARGQALPRATYDRRQQAGGAVSAAFQRRLPPSDSAQLAASLANLTTAALTVDAGTRYRIEGGLSRYYAFLDNLPRATLAYAVEATAKGGSLELVTEVIEYSDAELVLEWDKDKVAGARFSLASLFNASGATWSSDSGRVSLTYDAPVQVGYKAWSVPVDRIRGRIAYLDSADRASRLPTRERRDSLWRAAPAIARAADLRAIEDDVSAALEARVSGRVAAPPSVADKITLRADAGDLIVASRRKEKYATLGGGQVAEGAPLVRLRLASVLSRLTEERVGAGPPVSWRHTGPFATVSYYPHEDRVAFGCGRYDVERATTLTVTQTELLVDVDVPKGFVGMRGQSCVFVQMPVEPVRLRLVYPRATSR